LTGDKWLTHGVMNHAQKYQVPHVQTPSPVFCSNPELKKSIDEVKERCASFKAHCRMGNTYCNMQAC